MSGKTIQIYLPNGNPRSIKLAEITSRTVQVMLVPRANLELAAKRKELTGVGVYYLIGKSAQTDAPQLYVGEAEDCLVRLKQHNKGKDFWTHALIALSKTAYFTKSHVKFLESHSYQQAKRAGQWELENGSIPTTPYISESMEADLLDNFETIKILVSTLGYPLFEVPVKPKKKDLLICKGKEACAEGEYTSDGLIVFKGSTCNKETVSSAQPGLVKYRQTLIDEGVLVHADKVLRFAKDWIADSPSRASCVVLGRSSNGWLEWKYADGRTLNDMKR